MKENLKKIIVERVEGILNEGFNYTSEERAYTDKKDQEVFEAEISSALSFMQDVRSSSNKVKGQIDLNTTNQEVDSHLKEAHKHINEAIQSYFKTLSPSIKKEVIHRLGEVNIDNNEY